jgi:hypothetical protein
MKETIFNENRKIDRRQFITGLLATAGLALVVRKGESVVSLASEAQSVNQLTSIPLSEGSFLYVPSVRQKEYENLIWIEDPILACDTGGSSKVDAVTLRLPGNLTRDYYKRNIEPHLEVAGLTSNSKKDNSDTLVISNQGSLAGIVRKTENKWQWIWNADIPEEFSLENVENLSKMSANNQFCR